MGFGAGAMTFALLALGTSGEARFWAVTMAIVLAVVSCVMENRLP